MREKWLNEYYCNHQYNHDWEKEIYPTNKKCSIDPGRIHEEIEIALTGINSNESGSNLSNSVNITCNRFRLLF